MLIIDILRNSCHLLEFSARLLLVNIPSYLLSKSPEIDRLSSITFAYLTFQVVGLCWAFLVNAAFALATRITAFLPPMNLANELDGTLSSRIGSRDNPNIALNQSHLSSPYASLQLIATFYVSYASIRVVVSFAQSVFHIALESIKDFPDAALLLSKGGVFTLQLTPIVFVPALILELGLICADYFCFEAGDGGRLRHTIQGGVCNHTGLVYLTSTYSEVRKLVFYAVIVMVLQIWQAHLHQFPRWDLAFKGLTPVSRFLFQLAVLLLAILSIIATALVIAMEVEISSLEAIVCAVLLGWTIWLYSFTPVLVATHGSSWARRATPESLQHLAAYLRISHMLILFLMFSCACFSTGFVQAQLEMTFATIFIPALYSCFFLLASACIRAGSVLLFRGIPLSLVLSLSITLLLAKSGGKGGVMLVFLHILGKIIYFFGEEIDSGEEGDGWISDHDDSETLKSSEDLRALSETSKGLWNCTSHASDNFVIGESLSGEFVGDSIDDRLSEMVSKSNDLIPNNTHENLSLKAGSKEKEKAEDWSSYESECKMTSEHLSSLDLTPLARTLGNSISKSSGLNFAKKVGNYASRASSDALQLLSERGQEGSSFVSLGLPKSIGTHWLVKTSQRNMSYIGHIARAATMSDSIITGILRAFVAIAAVFTLILCTLSVASVAQQNLQFFPRSFDFEIFSDGSVLFDHKIVNVTLYPNTVPTYEPDYLTSLVVDFDGDVLPVPLTGPDDSHEYSTKTPEYSTKVPEEDVWGPQKKPHYAACSWDWHTLSLFDFALLSEVAYFDERQGNQVQQLVSTLFPGADFMVRLDGRSRDLLPIAQGGRPMYVELTSETLGVTVLAIRGTDVGRLHDFMEDIKMFAEPVVFTMLSGIFPTIRLWSQDTTSRVIEWLFNFNSFFGLQGEADYYKPLTQRIFQILESSNNSVMITGHSLGGGLARIVGTLTELPSVSFSPPGLALSYRKYCATRPDGSLLSITSKGAMHHESMAVITEFDWYLSPFLYLQ